MNKYFFDLVSQHRSEYDYRGREFPAPENAFQLAELIALDLVIQQENEWCGWAIHVRNAVGQQFFAIPVRDSDLAAA